MNDLHVEFESKMQGKEIKETMKLRVISFWCKVLRGNKLNYIGVLKWAKGAGPAMWISILDNLKGIWQEFSSVQYRIENRIV
jgi:hypothetical protein